MNEQANVFIKATKKGSSQPFPKISKTEQKDNGTDLRLSSLLITIKKNIQAFSSTASGQTKEKRKKSLERMRKGIEDILTAGFGSGVKITGKINESQNQLSELQDTLDM